MHKQLLYLIAFSSVCAHAMQRSHLHNPQTITQGEQVALLMEQCAQRCLMNPLGKLECTTQCMDELTKEKMRQLLLQKYTNECDTLRTSIPVEKLFNFDKTLETPDAGFKLTRNIALFKCAQRHLFNNPQTMLPKDITQKVWGRSDTGSPFLFPTDIKSKTKN